MKIAKFFALLCAVVAFASCETATPDDNPVVDATGTITLKVESAAVALGTPIKFTVVQDGQDVTSLASIYLKDGGDIVTIDGDSYTPATTGTYTFFATKGTEISANLSIAVLAEVPEYPVDLEPANTKFNHRVMILDHTGAGCGYCPLVTTALHELEKTDLKNNYNEVTCHGGSYAGQSDPGWSAAAEKIDDYTPGISGYPHVRINFTNGNLTSYSNPKSFENEVRNAFKKIIKTDGADVGIAMNVVGDSENVFVAASIKGNVTNEYKAVAWLLESKIINQNQYNYGTSYDYHYIYNHAVRNISGNYSSANVLGEPIGTLAAGETFNTAFQLPIVSKKWNVDNMEVIVIVSAKNAQGKWDVVNTAVCPVNQQITFEYLK